MKPLTQKETLELIKAKKLPPSVLKPYQMTEDENDDADIVKLAEAIRLLAIALNKADMDSKEEIKELISTLSAFIKKEQPQPKVIIENNLPDRPNKWEFDVIRDGNNMIRKVVAIAK